MTAQLGYIILAELLLSLFVIWGFLHESLFLRFEAKAAKTLRRVFSRKKRAAKKLRLIKNDRPVRKGPDRSAA